ncbi:DUF2764 family protein [Candidatus Uabimicrobium amorphum]|uniref:DUF2764 domain-containing protein n=1 Tax=Uabimicrobium amorphum TaxID=2596890 RepID=A0A5S9F4J0_UABAM|nr:DUF2764 family protein [Candidatus Uabimicrobium amorphum]BBM85351.1 hypothetical protein UABAM_03717 [Candidatus Uabimicrobium amorphum]
MKKYYLLASLPPLSFVYNEQPAISIQKFWQKVLEENASIAELVRSILLQQDIANMEKIANGYVPVFSGTIALEKLQKAKSDTNLLRDDVPQNVWENLSFEKWQSNVWVHLYNYQNEMAHKYNSCAKDWLEWEVGLRKYLANARAESLGTSLSGNLLVKALEIDSPFDYQRIVNDYHKQTSPLESEKLLDLERWKFADSLAVPYSFSDDEIVVYAIKLLILERWWAISQSQIDIFEKVANG